jgi:hypothetical protein
MDTPQPQPTNTEANIRKAAEAIAEVLQMKQEFIRCHDFLANRTARLVELLGQAESRGYLLEDSLTLVDTTYWLQHIDWQTKFLSMVLNFTKAPSRKTLRPLIELYGRDRDCMKVEVEILERQLKHRLAHFALPDDATVRKVMIKNEKRVLAIHLHVRSGYGGAALARCFKVPRSTAYPDSCRGQSRLGTPNASRRMPCHLQVHSTISRPGTVGHAQERTTEQVRRSQIPRGSQEEGRAGR